MIGAVLMAMLCGCSALPDASPEAAAPSELLALVADGTVDGAVIDRASEGQRVAYRRAPSDVIGVVSPSATARPIAIPLPVLPTSVPIVETEIAVMPESLATIDVWPTPLASGDRMATFERYDEFNQPRVFRILDEELEFFHVQVPMRPNGSTGYIRKSDVDVIVTDQRILIDLSERAVIVWDGDEVVLDTIGTVGRERTATPTGSYYVRNVFEWYADSVYGPYVIPLSAYSESIDQINGGDAVVAIHGTQRPDLIGSAASLGCVRLSNDVLRELAAIVEPGAPVEIIF